MARIPFPGHYPHKIRTKSPPLNIIHTREKKTHEKKNSSAARATHPHSAAVAHQRLKRAGSSFQQPRRPRAPTISRRWREPRGRSGSGPERGWGIPVPPRARPVLPPLLRSALDLRCPSLRSRRLGRCRGEKQSELASFAACARRVLSAGWRRGGGGLGKKCFFAFYFFCWLVSFLVYSKLRNGEMD